MEVYSYANTLSISFVRSLFFTFLDTARSCCEHFDRYVHFVTKCAPMYHWFPRFNAFYVNIVKMLCNISALIAEESAHFEGLLLAIRMHRRYLHANSIRNRNCHLYPINYLLHSIIYILSKCISCGDAFECDIRKIVEWGIPLGSNCIHSHSMNIRFFVFCMFLFAFKLFTYTCYYSNGFAPASALALLA